MKARHRTTTRGVVTVGIDSQPDGTDPELAGEDDVSSHFGPRTTANIISHRPAVCDICGVYAAQPVVERSTKVTLFFMRPFSVKRSTYHMECENCGHTQRVDH